MYECLHCGKRAVIWDNDFSFEEMGYDGDGIVHVCHCTHCGAEIECRISLEDEMNSVFNDEEFDI
jgi:transcription elongation factor Elf1